MDNYTKTLLSDRTYEFLKWFALIALNAFGVLYGTLGHIWGLPYTDEIPKTCCAIGTFIGTLIGISTVQYRAIKKEGEEQ